MKPEMYEIPVRRNGMPICIACGVNNVEKDGGMCARCTPGTAENDKTVKSDVAIERFDAFCARIKARLVAGKESYGDTSFERPVLEIIEEIKQEIYDQVGWSYIAYCRIVELEEKLRLHGSL